MIERIYKRRREVNIDNWRGKKRNNRRNRTRRRRKWNRKVER